MTTFMLNYKKILSMWLTQDFLLSDMLFRHCVSPIDMFREKLVFTAVSTPIRKLKKNVNDIITKIQKISFEF